jgi:hypothetical protein
MQHECRKVEGIVNILKIHLREGTHISGGGLQMTVSEALKITEKMEYVSF